ncbi:MAG TPA: MerR family transcriptional regulator [Haliangiales bacterium]|nr:MerR family transcriptional regulator [Haliangiales bacterium]
MGSRKAADPAALPDKLSFRIGEVARIVGVATSVLRYWETEFPTIRPEKSRANQRVYSRKQVERILEVRRLLRDERYTIDGARRALAGKGQAKSVDAALLRRVRKEVEELLLLVEE